MAVIKIRSNPYTRKIEYFEDGQNIETTNPKSRLCEIDKKSSFLPFYAKEIIDIIISSYYAGEKVNVIFEGTNEEFSELQKVCLAKEIADKVILTKASDTLENAQAILAKTKELFKIAQPIIAKMLQEDSAICRDISLISNTLDDIVPICVFGNVSSGKSTFINALIGNEILPSGGDPVTAKIYEIKKTRREGFAQIQFVYHEEPVCVTFEDCKYTIDGTDSDLVQKLKDDLSEMNCNEQTVIIRKAIEIINAHEKVDADTIDIGSIIKLEVPFSERGFLGHSQNQYMIFDTPGSNSASNKDHTDVFEEALEGFSNGIPVWVTSYDTLDSTDNNKLCDDLLSIRALDHRFTMIIVNKADIADIPEAGFSAKKEEEIKDYEAVRKMYASGIFFVSSVLGLGAKHEGKLNDRHYRKIYRTLNDIYSDPEDEDYTNLYHFNIMPIQIKQDMCEESAKCTDLMYANSGLFGIERQIENFGVKYSAYNKCQMAYAFLSRAIEETEWIIARNTENLRKLKKEHEQELVEKERLLLKEISELVAERETAYANETATGVMNFVRNYLNFSYSREDMEALNNKIAEKVAEVTNFTDHREAAEKAEATVWKRFSENIREVIPDKDITVKGTLSELFQGLAGSKAAKKEWNEAQREMDSQISDLVIAYVAEDYRKNFIDAKMRICIHTEYNWKNCAEQMKKLLIEKVTNSSDLTDDQRERLSGIVVDYKPLAFDDDTEDVFIKTKFLRGNYLCLQKSESLDIRRLTARYNNRLAQNIESMAEMINAGRYAAFKAWVRNLAALMESNIVELNPELHVKAVQIQEETEKIAEYEAYQLTISNVLTEIRQMMEWKTVDTEEM